MVIRPLTRTKLRKLVLDYTEAFSGWESVIGLAFARCSGPIRQMVDFQNLRSGDYRPSMTISTTVGPKRGLRHQFLDIQHMEISPREHSEKLDEIIRAMREQFVPSIVTPLNVEEILALCERDAPGKLNDRVGLASVHAYLGNFDRALEYSEQAEIAFKKWDIEPGEWMIELNDFIQCLKRAIAEGTSQELLLSYQIQG